MSTLAVSLDTPPVAPPPAELRVELTRVIAAPRARVFDAWTRPEVMRQWLSPKNMCTPVAETNPVEGGTYNITMQGTLDPAVAENPSQGFDRKTSARGTYLKVSPYDLLQFTWAAEWEAFETSIITLHFRDVEGGTELRLIHSKIATGGACQGYTAGWNGCLDKLEKLPLDAHA